MDPILFVKVVMLVGILSNGEVVAQETFSTNLRTCSTLRDYAEERNAVEQMLWRDRATLFQVDCFWLESDDEI